MDSLRYINEMNAFPFNSCAGQPNEVDKLYTTQKLIWNLRARFPLFTNEGQFVLLREFERLPVRADSRAGVQNLHQLAHSIARNGILDRPLLLRIAIHKIATACSFS